eukprot:1188634-Prorocentrum_minimum.AAC.1
MAPDRCFWNEARELILPTNAGRMVVLIYRTPSITGRVQQTGRTRSVLLTSTTNRNNTLRVCDEYNKPE